MKTLPAVGTDIGAFVNNCLDRWLELRHEFGDFEPRTDHSRASLERYLARQRTSSIELYGIAPNRLTLNQVCDWWEQTHRGLDKSADQYEYLHWLLTKLDRYFGTVIPSAYPLPNGHTLLAGMSWWAQLDDEPTVQSALPVTWRAPFRNLRVFDPAKHRLVDGWRSISMQRKLSGNSDGFNLRIGLHTLRDMPTTRFIATRPLKAGQGFQAVPFAREISTFAAYETALQKCVAWAVEREVNVLCLPELSVCREGRAVLKAAIKETGGGNLLFVLPGSFHDPLGDHSRNHAPVWAVQGGAIVELCQVAKMEPYDCKVPALSGSSHPMDDERGITSLFQVARSSGESRVAEDIVAGIPIRILTKIGLFGVAICRDQMSMATANSLIEPANDHIFNLSMLDYPAEIYAAEPSRNGTATFYVNAAHALPAAGEVSQARPPPLVFWHLPAIAKFGATLRTQRKIIINQFGVLPGDQVDKIASDALFNELTTCGGVCCDIPVPKLYRRALKD